MDIERDKVLAALRAHAPRALHVAEICARLEIPKARRDEVESVLGLLAEEGLVREMPGGRYRLEKRRPPAPAPAPPQARKPGTTGGKEELVGRFTMHPRGFGFVAAEDDGPDVFIPPPHIGAALHGDRVAVRAYPSPKGREGHIVRVVSRGVVRVAGILRRGPKGAWIEMEDARMRGPITLEGPILPEAKEGMVVGADITRYPRDADELPQARMFQVLGRPGVASVEVAQIKLREGIVEEFPPEVVEEAKAIPERVPEDEKRGREDLRGIDLVTIDPEDARDHDDAVWAERTKDGGFRVIVAIADVSHYVREGTAIDREALRRGCSVYLPDRAIPMLPRELSSNLASLVPNQDRLTLAVEVELAPTGNIRKHRYIDGVMRSGARLTYGGVARALHLTELGPSQHEAELRRDMLTVLLDVARILRSRRMGRGSLDFDLPEARVKLDEATGEPLDVYRSRQDPGVRQAYNLVEELMLLANEVVAADFARRGVPTIYRIHGPPNEEKIGVFARLAASVGYHLDPEAATEPLKLTAFLKRIEGTVHAQALGFLLLRAMQQATYDVTNIGHFGLAAKDYLHFTSPIRRYPDLAVHRVLRAVIHKDKIDSEALREKLSTQAAESSRLERRAMAAEREAVDLYRAILMRDRTGEFFDATITSVTGYGFYCTFDTPFVDALCPVEALGDDFYELDDLGVRLVGSRTGRAFALGDRITVRLESVSLTRRELTAQPVGALPDDRSLVSSERGLGDVEPRRAKRARADRGKGAQARESASRRGGARKTSAAKGRGRQDDTAESRRRRRKGR